MFWHWGGPREFNPMAILVPTSGAVRTIRFWQAFRDYKHGKIGALEQKANELFAFMERAA